jgi:hypothetical protein
VIPRAFAIVIALLVALCPATVRAHGRSSSWSTWTTRGHEIEVRVRLSRIDLSSHPDFVDLAAQSTIGPDEERALAAWLQRDVRIDGDGEACPVEPSSYRVLDSGEGFLSRGWTLQCGDSKRLSITSDLFLREIPSHLQFATLVRERSPAEVRLLTRETPRWEIGTAVSSSRFVDFVALGMRHVAAGLDHIVFVLALLVAAKTARSVVGVVTGFTIGHSATLALAVLGGVRPDVATIEALVGASIAVVAIENVWLERRDPWVARAAVGGLVLVTLASAMLGRGATIALVGLVIFVASYFGLLARSDRPERLRWAVAALFGTVHGFAFSGALSEMSLPRERLASALLGFNVGVEIAQIALIALAWPLWRLIARWPVRSRALVSASAFALAAGVFWLVDRTFA